MQLLKKAFDFFVFSSLFIAACAVLMVYQTYVIFDIEPSILLLLFVFAGSVCSYNFHWFLTPPHVPNASRKTMWNINYRYLHLAFFIAALIAAGMLTIMLIEHWRWLLLTAFLTFLYSAPKIPHRLSLPLRRIAIGKTIFLALAWTHITTLLPLLINSTHLTDAQICFVVNRFFYLYPICIIFDRRDVEEDRKAGIRSMITHFDERGIDILFWGCVVTFLIISVILTVWLPLTVVIILSLPAVILAVLYQPSKKSNSDYLYYFVLDGLMMLSAPLLILAKFAR